jgi:hypothetical protein
MYKRAQQVADLCEESSLVLAARVTRVHTHGLHASCAGALLRAAGTRFICRPVVSEAALQSLPRAGTNVGFPNLQDVGHLCYQNAI